MGTAENSARREADRERRTLLRQQKKRLKGFSTKVQRFRGSPGELLPSRIHLRGGQAGGASAFPKTVLVSDQPSLGQGTSPDKLNDSVRNAWPRRTQDFLRALLEKKTARAHTTDRFRCGVGRRHAWREFQRSSLTVGAMKMSPTHPIDITSEAATQVRANYTESR